MSSNGDYYDKYSLLFVGDHDPNDENLFEETVLDWFKYTYADMMMGGMVCSPLDHDFPGWFGWIRQ